MKEEILKNGDLLKSSFDISIISNYKEFKHNIFLKVLFQISNFKKKSCDFAF